MIRVVFAGNVALDDMNRVCARSMRRSSPARARPASTRSVSPRRCRQVRCREGDRTAACRRPRHVCRAWHPRLHETPVAHLRLRLVARRLRHVAQRAVEPLMESDPARFVVVTLRNDAAPVDAARRIDRARLRAAAVLFARAGYAGGAQAVASTHGLREITAWPIGLLGIHCVVRVAGRCRPQCHARTTAA